MTLVTFAVSTVSTAPIEFLSWSPKTWAWQWCCAPERIVPEVSRPTARSVPPAVLVGGEVFLVQGNRAGAQGQSQSEGQRKPAQVSATVRSVAGIHGNHRHSPS